MTASEPWRLISVVSPSLFPLPFLYCNIEVLCSPSGRVNAATILLDYLGKELAGFSQNNAIISEEVKNSL